MISFAGGALYVLCNYFIAYIPCWILRKAFYRLLGMKIGKDSRIMMGTIVTIPWKIRIGESSIINERCYLDGRGGLSIGDRVNIALFSMLVTGSHDFRSRSFEYYTEPIVVKDGVWIAARAMILNGCVLEEGCVVAAGAVVQPQYTCDSGSIYAGVPAKRVGNRGSVIDRDAVESWRVCFR